MKFTLLLTASPFTHQANETAFQFAKAALAKGHQINQVFFYQDAVYIGSRLNCTPSDESPLTERWQALAQQYSFQLTLCITASSRRGVLNKEEAARNEKEDTNIADGFQLVGLGQFFEACLHADRVMEFGA